MDAPDPSVFKNLEYEVPAPHLTGSDEQLGGKSGSPISFHLFSDSIRGILFDARVVRLEGAHHGVEAYGRAEQAFVGCIGEDESGKVSCIGTEGDGLKYGDDSLAKADHITICRKDNDGGVTLPNYVE